MSSDTFGPKTLKSWKYKEVDGYLIKKVIGTRFWKSNLSSFFVIILTKISSMLFFE